MYKLDLNKNLKIKHKNKSKNILKVKEIKIKKHNILPFLVKVKLSLKFKISAIYNEWFNAARCRESLGRAGTFKTRTGNNNYE